MAASVTLAQLRTDARLYADQRDAGSGPTIFISDTELTRLVNLKVRELYDLLVEARGGVVVVQVGWVVQVALYNVPILPIVEQSHKIEPLHLHQPAEVGHRSPA